MTIETSVTSGEPNSSAERACVASAAESSATTSSRAAVAPSPRPGRVMVANTAAATHATGISGCRARMTQA
jgi:hypothetical protein